MNRELFEPMGTKISPEMAQVWNAICNSLNTDTYHMLQWFIYTMVRAASPQHELTPEIKRLMTVLENDASWQNSINLVAPNGKYDIAQIVLIVEQKGKKGFGAVMVDKPFMNECKQTECVDDIIERIVEVCTKGIYRRLRQLAVDMDCQSVTDLLITMIDAQTVMNLEEENLSEMRGPANFSERGKPIEYGKKTKRKPFRGVEHMQTKIQFKTEDVPDLPEIPQ